jgi:hypothetical protein
MAKTAETPSASADSAAQPVSSQNFQSLSMLVSKQSWKVGSFKVIVCNPWTDTYTFDWQRHAVVYLAFPCQSYV